MLCCIWRCRSRVLGIFWMMKRLKAISFYECTQSGMKASQHLLLVSPVTQAERIDHLSRLPLLWSSVALVYRAAEAKSAASACGVPLCIPTGHQPRFKWETASPCLIFQSVTSCFCHRLTARDIRGRGNTARPLPNSRYPQRRHFTWPLKPTTDGVVLIRRDVM